MMNTFAQVPRGWRNVGGLLRTVSLQQCYFVIKLESGRGGGNVGNCVSLLIALSDICNYTCSRLRSNWILTYVSRRCHFNPSQSDNQKKEDEEAGGRAALGSRHTISDGPGLSILRGI